MLKDTCILVDDADVVQGSASKYDCHRFVPETPTGSLHRAFSVFLFDSQNRLLLQQRASSKVTFPEVCRLLSLRSRMHAATFSTPALCPLLCYRAPACVYTTRAYPDYRTVHIRDLSAVDHV